MYFKYPFEYTHVIPKNLMLGHIHQEHDFFCEFLTIPIHTELKLTQLD